VSGVVEYRDDPNGLAAMLGGLIEANVASHPERMKLLGKTAVYGIVATDADVAVSIRLGGGRAIIRNGVVGRPHILVTTDSDTLIGLSSVPLKFGLPDAMTKEGRLVNKKLAKGQLKVKGLFVNPGRLARLNRLLAV
jgi:hypothetical protein